MTVYAAGDTGVNAPEALFQPLAPYTGEARAAHLAGIVLIHLIVYC
jgi:hypothetical protein